VSNAKDLPQTNFALLRVHQLMKEEKKAKSMIEKYRVINPSGYLDINEVILRQTPPTKLHLYGIFEDELIYKESVDEAARNRRRITDVRKYSINKDSLFMKYFFMTEQTKLLFIFRKFSMCRHKFSCLENVIRSVYRTCGFYLIVRTLCYSLFSEQIAHFFEQSRPEAKDLVLLGEVSFMVLWNVF